MSSQYKFSSEEIEAITNARKENRDKRIEIRLKALLLRAEGKKSKEVSEVTGLHPVYITTLVRKYRTGGIKAITGNHYSGNRRNLTYEEETAILEVYKERAEAGQLVEVGEIRAAYQAAVDHPIGNSQIYRVLHRHGWRKIMPRSKHPKQASEEVIETSKKLRIK